MKTDILHPQETGGPLPIFPGAKPASPDVSSVRVAIVGTARSGTTIMGTVLRAFQGVDMLVEPFHPVYGIHETTARFPEADRGNVQHRKLIDDLLAGKSSGFRSNSVMNAISGWARPTSNTRTYNRVKKIIPQVLVIKDPFFSFSTRYLIEQYGFRIIWTIRHPAGILNSFGRLDWDLSLVMDEWRRSEIIDEATYGRATTRPAQIGIMWNAINRHLLEVYSEIPESIIQVRHEDFCVDPATTIENIKQHCNIKINVENEKSLYELLNGSEVIPETKRVHSLRRNAAALPDSWRKHVSKDDLDILYRECGEVYDMLYDGNW